MSSHENAAMKIQAAWHKYRNSKDTCPVCMTIIGKDSSTTKCGHKFCTGCLLKAVQINASCPLCRNDLLENQEQHMEALIEDDNDIGIITTEYDVGNEVGYEIGYSHGIQTAEEGLRDRMREEMDIATQQAYDDGIVNGRRLGDENVRLLREEYEAKIQNMRKEFEERIEYDNIVYERMCQSYRDQIKRITEERDKELSNEKGKSYIKQLDTMIESRKLVLKTLR